jgi:AmiR/NasT family two-component response regulator
MTFLDLGGGWVNENSEHQHLRVLIANQRSDRLDYVTKVVVSLGHEVVARSIEVGEVATVTRREQPDVAVVGLGDSSEHALELIDEIVRQAACPVITVLETDDHAFISEAAKRGVFAYITDTNPHQLQDSIEIVLRRFAEFQNLEGAFGRRAVIERAKGILMERHDTSEELAFEMLRTHARSANRKLIDIAAAVVDGRRLLPGKPRTVHDLEPATGGTGLL